MYLGQIKHEELVGIEQLLSKKDAKILHMNAPCRIGVESTSTDARKIEK